MSGGGSIEKPLDASADKAVIDQAENLLIKSAFGAAVSFDYCAAPGIFAS